MSDLNFTLSFSRAYAPSQFSKHTTFGSRAYTRMPGQNNIAQKIDTLDELSNLNFFRMQHKSEMVGEKTINQWYELFQTLTIRIENNEVVGVTSIVVNVRRLFHELIKFIEVHIRKELGREVADGETLAIEECRLSEREPTDNFFKKPNCIYVFDPAF